MKQRDLFFVDTWQKTLDFIRKNGNLDDYSFKSCFLPSELILDENIAIVLANDAIGKSIIEKQIDLIESSLAQVLDTKLKVNVILKKDFKQADFQDQLYKEPEVKTTKGIYYDDKISPNQNFDNFVVGDSNKHGKIAAFTIAANPGTLYNPIFIYGNSGLGKTHLLQAIGNTVKHNYPNYKMAYITGLEFVDSVYRSIKNGDIDLFKRDLSNLDILLIDDVQFIAGKEKTHEIFFSVFNTLINNRKQVVITSDRLPSEIKGLENRLISRFNSGLNVMIDPPEYETSVDILKLKLKNSVGASQIEIDDEVLNFIATNMATDVRELEGAINRLLFYAINFHDNSKITVETAMSAFGGTISHHKVKKSDELTCSDIIKVVANYYNLTSSQLLSKVRTKNIALARHIALYECRNILNLPYKKIGKECGNRDHSTIINSFNKITKQSKSDIALRTALNQIENQLKD